MAVTLSTEQINTEVTALFEQLCDAVAPATLRLPYHGEKEWNNRRNHQIQTRFDTDMTQESLDIASQKLFGIMQLAKEFENQQTGIAKGGPYTRTHLELVHRLHRLPVPISRKDASVSTQL